MRPRALPLVIALFLLSVFATSAQAQNNQPPVAGADSYTIHGATTLGSLYANDSDPEGDMLSDGGLISYPAHGTVSGVTNGYKRYTPDYGYVGADSFTYSVCDSQNLCTNGTVTISVLNSAPVASGEDYSVRNSVTTAHLLANDLDVEGDTLQLGSVYLEEIAVYPQHGTVYGTYTPDVKQYIPHYGYIGPDSFKYNVCDSLGKCVQATVTLFVLESDKLENAGPAGCNASVGEPINVATGNMWLQQADYALPGAGEGIRIFRTYNSVSTRYGLFGRGWSSDYDEQIEVYDSNNLRLHLGTGQAIYFYSSGGSTFSPMQTDFRGTLVKNANNTFTLTLKEGSVHQFSSAGKLLSLTDRNGNQTTLSYNTNNKLASVTDSFGRVLTFTTDPIYGYATSIQDTLGTIATYTYGTGAVLTAVEYPDGSKYQFSYVSSANGQVISQVTDAFNNVLEAHTYDSQGRALTSEKHGGVEKVTLSYATATRTDVTDALGRVTKYFFDTTKGRSLVTKIEGSCGCGGGTVSQTWAYDSQFNVTSKTNGLGQTTSYTYDTSGNPLTITDALGTTTFTYNGFGQVLTVTDSIGLIVTNTYDVKGNLLTSKDALNNETAFTYDTRGQLLTVTDARNKVTTFSYDTSGNLTEKTDAANNTTAFAYDARGRLTTLTDALNNVSSVEYDSAGHVKKLIAPDTTFYTLTYDTAGRRTKITDARNIATDYGYDSAYRLTSVTNADNKVTSYSYDLMSNLTGVTDALSRTTDYEYDSFNRLNKIIYPPAVSGAARLNEQIAYDDGGRVTSRTDRAGRATAYEYDSGNRLIKTTDPALKETEYEYNSRSLLTAVVDALDQRTAFTRDALGRVTQVSRNSLSKQFAYDAVGNRTSQTDYANQTTAYAYDNLNRLTTVTYPNSTQASYTYNALSKLLTATNAAGTVSFTYDALSRVSGTTDVFGIITNYAYDANGNRTEASVGTLPNVPPVAATATYTYDSLNRLTAITDSGSATVIYGYDAVDRLVSRTLPNSIVSTYQFDGLDRLTGLADVKGQGTIANAQYQYDAAGNITQKTDGSGSHGYSYDSIRRLTSAMHPGGSNESYAYDAVGNRTSSHRSTSYTYQPFNRLQTTSAATYSYDSNGNLLSKAESAGTTTFTWDYENRLTGVTPPTGPSISYKYDALGRRVERRTGTLDYTQFTYDGQDVVLDRNGDGSTVSYLNGPGLDNKLRQSGLSGTFYYLSDHLRSTTALTDALGNVVEQNSYDSFGDGTGSARTRYGYTGRERDQTTGLYYYRARWYDSQEGRFISEDPIGFSGGVNFYAYVGGNPLTRRDPSGLDWLQNLSDFAAGFGDTISFGWTATIRQHWHFDDVVNRCSGWYKAGEWTGTAHQLVSAGAGIAKVTGGILARRAASRAAREAAEELAEEVVESNLDDGVRIIKEYMGEGATASKPPGGSDLILRSADGTKKIRFDLVHSHGDLPHINFEVFQPRGWYPNDPKMIRILNEHIYPKP